MCIQLAGLHYYSLPWIGLLVDGHRAHSPDWIKRPVSHIVHGLVDAILKCLPIASAALSKVDSFSGNRISNLITRIRRIPIPLRTATEGLLELLSRLQPSTQYKLLNSEWIPYPWLPGSIDDIPAFMNRTVESPTIGVFFSVLCIATFDDLCLSLFNIELLLYSVNL